MKAPFTIYRCSHSFIKSLTFNPSNLALHVSRTVNLSINPPELTSMLQAIGELYKQGHLLPAAKVNCLPNDLFALTNSIERHWTKNAEVTVLPEANAFMSSTSVGDLFSDADGIFYVVSCTGMLPLNLERDGSFSRLQRNDKPVYACQA
jgi:hypothetical protein